MCDEFKCKGNKAIIVPEIDALRTEGTVFAFSTPTSPVPSETKGGPR